MKGGEPIRSGSAWFDRLIATYRRQVRRTLGDEWLPRTDPRSSDLPLLYGCGGYGCVFPTVRADTVLKVTRDVEEATYVACALTGGLATEGVVRYVRGFELPEYDAGDGYDERCFFLWREEVYPVGSRGLVEFSAVEAERVLVSADTLQLLLALRSWGGFARETAYDLICGGDLPRAVNAWKASARESPTLTWSMRVTRDTQEDGEIWSRIESALRGLPYDARVARALGSFRVVAQEMALRPSLRPLAQSLLHALTKGVLLADTKPANVGLVKREGRWGIVLADPGYGLFFVSELAAMSLPPLPTARPVRPSHTKSSRT